MLRSSSVLRIGLVLGCVATTACGDANLLPPATLGVRDDTITLWAITGSSIALPSAWDQVLGLTARTDRTSSFDWAFDFVWDSVAHDTVPALLPRGALGLGVDGGLLKMNVAFDSLRTAPGSGYDGSAPVYLDSTTVIATRSRTQTCNFGLYSGIFAKATPLAISRSFRKLVLRLVTDPNCGYRSLAPGIPGN